MDNLSNSEQDALNEFVAITDVSLDDPDTTAKAVALLTRHSFNLNNAVLAFFDLGLDVTPEPELDFLFAEASGAERFEGTAIHRNLHEEFALDSFLPRLLNAPRIANAWQFDLGRHLSRKAALENEKAELRGEPRRLPILWLIFLILPKTVSFIYSLLRSFLGIGSDSLIKSPRSHFNYDTYDEDFNLKSEFDDEVASAYNLATANFNVVHEASQKEYDFLVVVLVDNSTAKFAETLLRGEQFSALFNKDTGTYKETKLYFGNIEKSPEAFEVAKTYKARRTPYVMLVGNVSNNPGVMSSMSIIYKSNCYLGDDDEAALLVSKVTRNLHKCTGDYNPQLVTKRFDKQEIEMSRLIKEKQDEAYLESLHHDKIKKIEKEKKLQAHETSKKLESMKNGYLQHLISSNYFEEQVNGTDAAGCVRVSIKMPDGKRAIQKFSKAASLAELHLFVQTQLFEATEAVEAVEMSVAEYVDKFAFPFEMFKPFPKETLPATLESLEEFGRLKSGDNILVEYADDE